MKHATPKTSSLYCECCGGTRLSCTADWIVFERLTFCSPECRDDHAEAEQSRRDLREQVTALRSMTQAAQRPSRKRAA
jgi:hypothetical protein